MHWIETRAQLGQARGTSLRADIVGDNATVTTGADAAAATPVVESVTVLAMIVVLWTIR